MSNSSVGSLLGADLGAAQPVRQGGLVINVALARKRRLDLGLSLEQLGIRMGVDKADLSRWENGLREPKLRHLASWEQALDLEPGALYLGAGIPEGDHQ